MSLPAEESDRPLEILCLLVATSQYSDNAFDSFGALAHITTYRKYLIDATPIPRYNRNMPRANTFSTWYTALVANSLQKDFNEMVRCGTNPHYASRLRIRGDSYWQLVYAHGVSPDIDSVIAWSEGRDEPFSNFQAIAA